MNHYIFEGVIRDILDKKSNSGRPYSLFIVEDTHTDIQPTQIPFYRCNDFSFIQKGMKVRVEFRLDNKSTCHGPAIDVQVLTVTELGVDKPRMENCKRLVHILESRQKNLKNVINETTTNQYRERKRQFEHKGK
jgi:hypothetical protein